MIISDFAEPVQCLRSVMMVMHQRIGASEVEQKLGDECSKEHRIAGRG